MAPLSIFQRNPRNVSIASWALAAAAFGAWYQYDKKKEREFSDSELQRWNEEVMRKNPRKPRRERVSERASEQRAPEE